jgi:endonuclease YncB( thermonuclease family)
MTYLAGWWPLLALAAVAGIYYAVSASHSGIGATQVRPQAELGVVRFAMCRGGGQQNCVIDGDTIRYGGMTVRLADIDAPEVRDFKCEAELALGNRATQRLLVLMNDGPFELIAVGNRDRDKYGRSLRTVERNGQSLGSVLVAERLARRWDGARHSWCN